MMQIVPAEAAHITRIRAQAAQRGELTVQGAVLPSPGWTALVDGDPMVCAGLLEMWPGRAYAWALLDARAGRHLVAITRAARRALDASGFRRIEMAVAVEFQAAARWAVLLGFALECRAMAYFPGGGDAFLYARVKQ